VTKILDAIVNNGDFEKGEVLLPLHCCDECSIVLVPAKDCTVATGPSDIALFDEDKEIKFVWTKVDRSVAMQLGAVDLRQRTTSGVEDIIFDDKYGQEVDLKKELETLLKEQFNDGFSVPKVSSNNDFFLSLLLFLFLFLLLLLLLLIYF
jgi:hypothetical protein